MTGLLPAAAAMLTLASPQPQSLEQAVLEQLNPPNACVIPAEPELLLPPLCFDGYGGSDPEPEVAPPPRVSFNFGVTSPAKGFKDAVLFLNDWVQADGAMQLPRGYELGIRFTGNRNFADGGEYTRFELKGLRVGPVEITPSVRFLDVDGQENTVEGVVAASIPVGSGNLTGIYVRNENGFSVRRLGFTGEHMDARIGQKRFPDGDVRTDYGVGVYGENGGVWVGHSTERHWGLAGFLNTGTVGAISGVKYDHGTGFGFVQLAVDPEGADKETFGPDTARFIDLAVGDVFIPEFKHMGPNFLGNGPRTAEVGYFDNGARHYGHVMAGGTLGSYDFGRGTASLALGGGVHANFADGGYKLLGEALLFVDLKDVPLVDTFYVIGSQTHEGAVARAGISVSVR